MKKEILLDLSGIIDEETFHEYVSKKLNFPGYYGYNFDAFWDCLTDDEQYKLYDILKIEGLSDFQKYLPDSYAKFMECIKDYKLEFPQREVFLIMDSPSGEGIEFEDGIIE